MSDWREARNILAVRLDNIGDVIMLGPALRAVKETSPEARITLLASPAGSTGAPLLPWVDDVIVWRPVWQDVGGHMPFDPRRERDLIGRIAERGFDAALIFTSFNQTPHVPGYVCYLAGIPLRAGESKEFGGSTLSTELRGAPDDLHQVELNLRLVEHLGFTVRDRRMAVAIPTEARAAVPRLLAGAGLAPQTPFILLHPGASAQARRFPPERSREVAHELAGRGWPVLVTGTEREAAIVETVAGDSAPGVHPLFGRTTLAEYAALVERASLVICGNTLPLHLADALGTPVLALYSGTDYEEQWRPRFTRARLLRRETGCHPCYLFECPIGQPCLDIPAAEVAEAALELVGRPSPPTPLPVSGEGSGGHISFPPRPALGEGGGYPLAGAGEGRRDGAAAPIQRIAILRALHLGDLLLAVPALRSIRAGFPDAEITLIGLPWAASFVERFRHYLDRFVEFGGYPGIGEVEVDPERTARFVAEQRAYGYDLVIQMHGSGKVSNPCALALGGRMTVGYYEGTPPDGLTLAAVYPHDQPEILRNLGLAEMLGCPDRRLDLEFPIDDRDRSEARQLLDRLPRSGRPWVGLHPGARPPARRWPAERFAAVADALAGRFGARIIITGGPGEEDTARAVAERMTAVPLVVAGETSLGGLAALIDEMDLFISNDTGPAHIAVAVGTPSVTIFGPADHRRWAPLDHHRHPTIRHPVPCSPCSHWECPIDHRCLRWVEPAAVIEVAERLVATGALACDA